MATFLRRDSGRFSKLGKKRKNKQKWKKPTGRDNKMREKKKGYPAVVSIGYGKDKSIKGKIREKTPVKIKSLNELNKIKQGEIVIIGKIGMKKKIEIVQKAKEKKIEIYGLNIEKFLKETSKKDIKKSEEKKEVKKVETKQKESKT